MTEENTKLLEIKNDTMWFSGSPILLCAMCLELDKITGELFSRVKFQNLKYEIIHSIVFDLICYDEYRNPICRVEYISFGNADAQRFDTFGYERKVKIPDSKTRNIEYVIRRIDYYDGPTWENTEKKHFNRRLEQENIYAAQGDYNKQFIDICVRSGIDGTNLVLQPIFEDEFWMCACGAFNWIDERKCASCRVGRDWLRNSTNMSILEKHRESQEFESNRVKKMIEADADQRKQQDESQKLEFERRNEAIRQQKKRETSKNRRKRLLLSAILLIVLAIVAYCLMTFVFPRFLESDEYAKKHGKTVETLAETSPLLASHNIEKV